MLVDLCVTIMQVTVPDAIMLLEISTYADERFCSKYMGGNFYCNYADGVSVAIMQVVFLQCIMHMDVSIVIIQVTLSFIAM